MMVKQTGLSDTVLCNCTFFLKPLAVLPLHPFKMFIELELLECQIKTIGKIKMLYNF